MTEVELKEQLDDLLAAHEMMRDAEKVALGSGDPADVEYAKDRKVTYEVVLRTLMHQLLEEIRQNPWAALAMKDASRTR